MNNDSPQPIRAKSFGSLMKMVIVVVALGSIVGVVAMALRPEVPVLQPPTNSDDPWFDVQLVKPMAARPLGGLFGLLPQEDLGFNHASPQANVGSVNSNRISLSAQGWDLMIQIDDDGMVTSETRLKFTMELGGKMRNLCCRPAVPASGYYRALKEQDPESFTGQFLIELAECEIEESGKKLDWPPAPLTLRGSFSRLSMVPTESAFNEE